MLPLGARVGSARCTAIAHCPQRGCGSRRRRQTVTRHREPPGCAGSRGRPPASSLAYAAYLESESRDGQRTVSSGLQRIGRRATRMGRQATQVGSQATRTATPPCPLRVSCARAAGQGDAGQCRGHADAPPSRAGSRPLSTLTKRGTRSSASESDLQTRRDGIAPVRRGKGAGDRPRPCA